MIAAALLALLAQDRPLRNDCVLGISKELGDELARGDELPARSAQAFDAWRNALLIGAAAPEALAPLAEARGGECAELAVLRRLGALGADGWKDWRARFEDLARGELARVPAEEDALERFVAAHAGTESAQRAALRLVDLARERGEQVGLERVRSQGPIDAALDAALSRRASPAASSANQRVSKLERVLAIELEPDETGADWIPERRAGAALAQLGDGRILWWTAGALRAVDAEGKLERFELAALSPVRAWNWLPPFRDGPSPWTPTLIARGSRALVLLGRARGRDGNLFAAFDFAPRGGPLLAWAWGADGLRTGEAETERVLPAGLWEYQPGASESGGRVSLLARRYADSVDELHGETWCLCLELASGTLLWQRKLGVGADPATRDPARRPEPRGFCTPADPIALADGRLWCSTGLGWLSVIEQASGRVLASWRAGLEAEELGTRELLVAPIGSWQPAASKWCYRAEPGGEFELEPADGSRRVALAGGRSWSIRHEDGALALETRLAGVPGARAGVALPRGERPQAVLALGAEVLALATERAVYLFDDRDPMRLVERALLPVGARTGPGGSGALVASGDRIWCAVGSALAAFRSH